MYSKCFVILSYLWTLFMANYCPLCSDKQCLDRQGALTQLGWCLVPLIKPLLTAGLALTTTSITGVSLTCPSAVSPLAHRPPRVAPEQLRACESRLACKHSRLSQIVNPMIQAGTRLLPAPVSSQLYTLASANGEQMQGNRKPWQLHADNSPPQAYAARQPLACGPAETCQKSWAGPPYKKTNKKKKNIARANTHAHEEELKTFSTYVCIAAPAKASQREQTHRENTLLHSERKIGGFVLTLRKVVN